METGGTGLLVLSMYFLATINPASKIFLLASMDPPYSPGELFRVSLKSSATALIILVTLACAGKFLLVRIFSIDIFSIRIAGGLVLFSVGLKAVGKGRFYEKDDLRNVSDISIVPLAAPLIAGPAAIASGIALAPANGLFTTSVAIFLAVFANMLLMLLSLKIGRLLERIHAIGPLIRITGLIVMSMAVQMILQGVRDWIATLGILSRT